MAEQIPVDLRSFRSPLKHSCTAKESIEGGFIDIDTPGRDTLKGKELVRTGGKANPDRNGLGCPRKDKNRAKTGGAYKQLRTS